MYVTDEPEALDYDRSPKPGGRNWLAVFCGIFLIAVPTYILFMSVTYLFAVPLVVGLVLMGLGLRRRRTGAGPREWVQLAIISVTLATSVGPCALLWYANQAGLPVHFIVPTGFRGGCKLVVDPQGIDIPIVNGQYVITFPPDGILFVRSTGPLNQWHSTFASFDDGTPIPRPYDRTAFADRVAFRDLGCGGSVDETGCYFFVGTVDELGGADFGTAPMGHIVPPVPTTWQGGP